MERLLVETDGPEALEWVNGEYAYPSIIKDLVKKICNYKSLSLHELNKLIEDNYNSIMSL